MSLQGPEAGSDAAEAQALDFDPSTGGRTGAEPATPEALLFDESTGGGNLFGTPGREPSPPPEPASLVKFPHILNEYLEGSSMVAGIVPATPVVLATNFFHAYSGEIRRDDALQAKVTALLDGIPEYAKEVKARNLAVALVDLSADQLEPRYAGVNDRENFYAASVAKVCGLLAAYQLKADVNAFLRNTDIQDISVLENALQTLWSAQGIPPQHQPLVNKILEASHPGHRRRWIYGIDRER